MSFYIYFCVHCVWMKSSLELYVHNIDILNFDTNFYTFRVLLIVCYIEVSILHCFKNSTCIVILYFDTFNKPYWKCNWYCCSQFYSRERYLISNTYVSARFKIPSRSPLFWKSVLRSITIDNRLMSSLVNKGCIYTLI